MSGVNFVLKWPILNDGVKYTFLWVLMASVRELNCHCVGLPPPHLTMKQRNVLELSPDNSNGVLSTWAQSSVTRL
jgi:hypothetical protein